MATEETKQFVPETITLNDEDVLQVFVDPALQNYRAGTSREGGTYFRIRFRGGGGTCPQEFKDAMDIGDVLKVTLTSREFIRQVPDPNNAGQMKDQIGIGWQIDSYATSAQIINLLDKSVEVVKRRANLEAIRGGAKVAVPSDQVDSATMKKVIENA